MLNHMKHLAIYSESFHLYISSHTYGLFSHNSQNDLYFFYFLFFLLYIIVLVLPNIKMNPPQVFKNTNPWTAMCSKNETGPLSYTINKNENGLKI